MNILYIHQYFNTPKEPGGTRSYWISKKLVDRGFKVIVITSKRGSDQPRFKTIEGIKIIYVNVSYDQSMNLIQRAYSFLKFTLLSTIEALKIRNVKMVIATSTPLTIGIPALIIKIIKKTPFIFEVRDLWPDVPIEMGAIKNPILIKLLKALEIRLYKESSHIVALSPGMKDGITKYVQPNKISVIPNMAKIAEFWPRNKNLEIMEHLKLGKNQFRIIHFGAIGKANDIITILKSFKSFNNKDYELIFAGGGSEEFHCINYCKENNLDNVRFIGRHPMDKISEIVNLCDVSLVSFKNIPILYTNSPNKFFDSLSAGKPILVNSAGWTKDIVEKNKCGLYFHPENPKEFEKALKILKEDIELYNQMSLNARKLAINKYDKEILTEQFYQILYNLCL